MKLLVVEDNSVLIESLKTYLGKHYIVNVATTGREGIDEATTEQYDVIILDLFLPDINGAKVCKAIRQANVTTPILVLTAINTVSSKVLLFDNGADDYLAKPFNVAELHARLKALVRRVPAPHESTTILNVGDLTIDVNRRTVKRAKQPITLRRKEFDILEYLMRNRAKVVTRSMIINNVWDANRTGWNNTVDVHVKHLRDKVDKPFAQQLIQTTYGVGYIIDDA
jgi:DNA-binding response OmpR family regulator